MSRWREVDGFHLFSGVVSLIAGPVMLAMGAPAGWAFLIIGAGSVVLLAQWALVSEITFTPPDAATFALGSTGVVLVAIAVVYLTRAADDLPTIFPGYDTRSESFRLVPGLLMAIVGAVAVGRAIANVHPIRAQHQEVATWKGKNR